MSEIVRPQLAGSATAADQLADCSPAEQIELRYLNAANALLDDAAEINATKILVDVLTWTLARVIDGCGTPAVAGHVLHCLGKHTCTLAAHRCAQEESAKAIEAGHAPN